MLVRSGVIIIIFILVHKIYLIAAFNYMCLHIIVICRVNAYDRFLLDWNYYVNNFDCLWLFIACALLENICIGKINQLDQLLLFYSLLIRVIYYLLVILF